jgi:DNA polymerase III delta subunit
MVKRDRIYLITGQDAPAKDKAIKEIKSKYLPVLTEQFNLDIVYAKDLTLKDVQEKLLYLAASSGSRMIVIKQASALKKDIKDYLEKYAQAPDPSVILVLEMEGFDRNDRFTLAIAANATTRQFRQEIHNSVFALADEIRSGKTAGSLMMLNQLLKKGQKPELILGALRSGLSRNTVDIAYMRRLNKMLLECDMAIKTSSLKPSFALERLVVRLCGFKHAFR